MAAAAGGTLRLSLMPMVAVRLVVVIESGV